MITNQERLKEFYRGGDNALERLIEHCGLFPDRLPSKNKLQSWLIDARKEWRIEASENGMVDLEGAEEP